ncbi:MAG: DUF4270 domain-containing protein [Bacteroidetes bacterium]|nr:DUF4270 domain-containing protein [Bacteroidota bacterium]
MNLMNTIPAILSRAIGTKFFLFLSLVLTFSFTSCDESNVVGLDVQPEGDLLNVGYQDTTTVRTRTVKGDSLITDETLITTGIGLIGKYVDPVFGTATASMYTQMRLPSNISSTSFGTLPICDSIVLSLVYEGTAYGKKDRANQKISVYQLSQPMTTSATYYSNSTLSKNTNDLVAGSGIFTPRPTEKIVLFGDTVKAQLRVPLDNAFGQLLLNSQLSGNLATNTAFQNFFNGMYITTENTTTASLLPDKGNILHFKMGESLMTVYYHNSNPINNDSLKYDFSLGSIARFNHYDLDYSAANPGITTQLATPTLTDNAVVYVQSMGGTKTKIDFPFLEHWLDSAAISINKAELVISVDTTMFKADTFAIPNAFILFGINDDGTTYAIPDAFEGPNYFGGTANTGTLQYRFNIARYIQQILNGDRNNNGLYLLASNGAVFGNRVILSGGSTSAVRPMKLNITYTKLH